MSFFDNFSSNPGIYVSEFIKMLMDNFGDFFDGLTKAMLKMMLGVEKFLLFFPWWVIIGFVVFLGWKYKKLTSGILYGVFLFAIGTFGYWKLMIMTLGVVMTSVLISLVIGIPLGILAAYKEKINIVLHPILDAMQTMPSFVYLIPAMILFGLGKVPAVFATIIYAIPPVIRLTYLGIKKVPREMVEASEAFGASSWQTLVKVQLPQALPTIMTGINQTTMMALAMVVIASMIGAQGLGHEVLIAINRMDIAMGFNAGISIVFLAIIIDRISQGVAEKFKFPE